MLPISHEKQEMEEEEEGGKRHGDDDTPPPSLRVSRLHAQKDHDLDRYHLVSASLSEAESSLRRLEGRAMMQDIESGKMDQQREQDEKEMGDTELEEKLLADVTDLQEKLRIIGSNIDRHTLLQRRYIFIIHCHSINTVHHVVDMHSLTWLIAFR
jgi:hypothetical protein